MQWPEEVAEKLGVALSGVSPARLAEVETALGGGLPSDLREFLLIGDGGLILAGRFVLLSAGDGICAEETLVVANSLLAPEHPILVIGRDASDYFGFKKQDLTDNPGQACPVHFIFHETGELDRVADSFRAFLEGLLKKP